MASVAHLNKCIMLKHERGGCSLSVFYVHFVDAISLWHKKLAIHFNEMRANALGLDPETLKAVYFPPWSLFFFVVDTFLLFFFPW